MIGQRFGRLVAVKEVEPSGRTIIYECVCDCGTVKRIQRAKLRSGNTKSCGCLRKENARARITTHGHTESSTYKTWCLIKERCSRENNKSWAKYGGRGIKVCDRWMNSFENFLEDMGARPFLRAQLDRKDNNKGYSPDNCRWVTCKENNNNRRDNIVKTFNGLTLTLPEWAEKLNINYKTLLSRHCRKWSDERLFSQSVRHW